MPVGHGFARGDLPALFLGQLERLGFDPRSQILGLAVSGGGDSMAMLHLARAAGLRAQVATVDHGLRAEAAAEAQLVAQVAADLGYAHQTLHWRGWDGRGNIQDRARRARRRLLAQWAAEQSLGAVALAHTMDDSAETFVMRLARGAGVDGLAAMQPRFVQDGAVFLRPLLEVSRAQLRDYVRAQGGAWVEDPSNDQTRFDRVRARKALPALQTLGIGASVLADVAQHLRAARGALDYACDDLARRVISQTHGIVRVADGWQLAPPELQRRLLQRLVLWIAPADYAPRGAALAGALARLTSGQPVQLAGCHFLPQSGGILGFREMRRSAPPCDARLLWDGLWRVQGVDLPQGAQIGPLGPAGLAQWVDWRGAGLPRAALLAQPSLCHGETLIATPLHPALGASYAFFRHPSADSLYCARLAD